MYSIRQRSESVTLSESNTGIQIKFKKYKAMENIQLSKEQKQLILQVVSGGAFGLGILFALIGQFAFNSEEFIHDDKLGMELGMELDMETQITNVWVRVPQVLHVKTVIGNVRKINEDGEESPGGIGDLFPVTGPTYGAVEVNIEILAADDDEMPDLSAHDQSVVPMGYVRETSKFPIYQRYSMLGFAYTIKHWAMVKLAIYGSAIGMIAVGLVMRYLNKQKVDANLVTEIKVAPDEMFK